MGPVHGVPRHNPAWGTGPHAGVFRAPHIPAPHPEPRPGLPASRDFRSPGIPGCCGTAELAKQAGCPAGNALAPVGASWLCAAHLPVPSDTSWGQPRCGEGMPISNKSCPQTLQHPSNQHPPPQPLVSHCPSPSPCCPRLPADAALSLAWHWGQGQKMPPCPPPQLPASPHAAVGARAAACASRQGNGTPTLTPLCSGVPRASP